MNSCLVTGMVRVRNALSLSNIFIVEKPTVRAETDTDEPEGEPDITFYFSAFDANEPHAIIECKRLDPSESPKQLRSRYVRTGIDRFVNGLYGHGHEIDFMLAYVLKDDELAAVRDLNVYLHSVQRRSSVLRKTTEYGAYGFVAESNHVRTLDQHGFLLLHSFVCFPAADSDDT